MSAEHITLPTRFPSLRTSQPSRVGGGLGLTRSAPDAPSVPDLVFFPANPITKDFPILANL